MYDVERVRDPGERVNRQVGAVLDLLDPLHGRSELGRELLLREALFAPNFGDTATDVAHQGVRIVAGHDAGRSQRAIEANT